MGDEDYIESYLQKQFTKNGYHIYRNGGLEFYNKIIKSLIIPYIQKTNIWFEQLSKEELDELGRSIRIKHEHEYKQRLSIITDIMNYNPNDQQLSIITDTMNYNPNGQQEYILEKIVDFYKNNDIGKLIWACGLGKTLLSIFIIQKLHFDKIVIGVVN